MFHTMYVVLVFSKTDNPVDHVEQRIAVIANMQLVRLTFSHLLAGLKTMSWTLFSESSVSIKCSEV